MNEFIELVTQLNESVPVMVWVSALILCVALWINYRSHRRTQQIASELKQIKQDLRAITLSAIGVGGRVMELEKSQGIVKQAPVEQQQMPAVVHTLVEPTSVENTPYDQAIYMARTGANADDISMACGVSQNEAELIQIMHRLDKAS